MTRYRAAIDIGGTFTDLVITGADGTVHRAKVPSTPDDYARGVLEGLGQLLERAGIPPAAVEAVLHGTTVGTNTILQGRGARVGLLTTRGFRDVLEIGRLRRATLHDLSWNPPRPLVRRAWRLEVAERIDARGQVVVPLDEAEVRERVAWLRREGVEALAVSLINAHANPLHERAIARLVRTEQPGLPLSVSTEIAPVAREYERTSTAVVNAYIGPAVVTYLRRLEAGLRAAGIPGRLWVMQSNGGLLSAEAACRAPVLLVESGPAAGVWGAAAFARDASRANLIAFDMGGTTAKASLLEGGDPARVATLEVGAGMNTGDRLLRGVGYPIHVAAFDLAEVGAGGGSIAWVDAGGALRVGPQSAGAVPGPACYGQGGTEPSVTDAYVVLGYVNPSAMAGGRLRLSPGLAERAITARIAKPLGLSVPEAAHGIFEVAKANMIRAIKAVSTERGRDPAEFGLLAFGGAGPVHAAALAEALDMERVMCPAAPGLFSALGMLLAEAKRDFATTLLRRLDVLEVPTIQAAYDALEAAARSTMRAEGFATEALRLTRSAELRYVGQDFELPVSVPGGALGPVALEELAEGFAQEHERVFGHRNAGEPVVLVNAGVHASSSLGAGGYREIGARLGSAAGRRGVRLAYFGPDEGMREATVLQGRGALVGTLRGPAIIEEEDATTLIPPGWQARLEAGMTLEMTPVRTAERPATGRRRRAGDPVTFELLRHALLSTVQEMGLAIVRTAYSVGVRDIMDFGTALCDAEGQIVAQAQTMAIHLGAIPPALAAVRHRFGGDLRPGDLVILNDPYHGGMHLADIFMFQPLFLDGRLIAFAAITAHQVDMGGSVPGGNAAGLTEIYQEGLRIPPLKLVEAGRLNETLMAMIQRNVRIPHQVAGDIRSMMAGCHAAGRALERLAARYGVETLTWAMTELLAYAERMARAEIAKFPEGTVAFEDHLDDDGVTEAPVRIRVTLGVRDGRVHVDFAGSSAQVRGGINATLSVAQSAAYFALRCAMTSDVPDNSGYYRLVEVTAPEGSVVNPRFPACCAAKGVTAFRVCDAILGALAEMLPERMTAAGEGGATIVTFGGTDQAGGPFVLMDLVLGGMGGRPDRDGVEGIANPSCNVRNTPIEIVEATFPIRVEAYGFVPDTGGAGRFRGALSMCREYRFLGRDGVLQVRSDRHRYLPYGVAGGHPGTPSRNTLWRAGAETALPPKFVIPIEAGDVFRHVQAGAGGYGPPADRDPKQVLEDVRDGKISAEYARRIYGPQSPYCSHQARQ